MGIEMEIAILDHLVFFYKFTKFILLIIIVSDSIVLDVGTDMGLVAGVSGVFMFLQFLQLFLLLIYCYIQEYNL